MDLASERANTPSSKSSALLVSVTRCDHRPAPAGGPPPLIGLRRPGARMFGRSLLLLRMNAARHRNLTDRPRRDLRAFVTDEITQRENADQTLVAIDDR